ncbi:MAG: glutathione S-transferase family protein [Beijerinckiaceae bacterium]|nr:glutathione S-transferase family protein [Beijerinckiaceae bacterium]
MKLYDGGRAPNPRRVRIFLAEKGLSVPIVPVDIGNLEHKGPAYTQINPYQLVPALELDDGSVIGESVAICRYFEELHPEPPLFGTGAKGKAEVEMWNRRVEFSLYQSVQAVFRHLHPAMAEMQVPQIPAWGDANKARVIEMLESFDVVLGQRPFLSESGFSIADISAGITVDFMKPARLLVPEALTNVHRWHAALRARPSWQA